MQPLLKQNWDKFITQLQLDILDVLQNNILNFSTLLGVITLYFKYFKPQYQGAIENFTTGYLLVATSGKK